MAEDLTGHITPRYDKRVEVSQHGLEFLLSFDGQMHRFEDGCWAKFEIKQVKISKRKPHGLSYSLTLHASDGTRLIGFDNAHRIRSSHFKRSPQVNDHWHRTRNDPGRPYQFKDADTLLVDFYSQLERVLKERGTDTRVIQMEDKRRDNDKV